MKKKLTVLIVCIGLFAGMSVNAQNFKTVQDSNTVIYSDNITPDAVGICFVVKKGGSIEDNENVYMLKNVVSGSNGHIEFRFNMSERKNGELTDGEYDVYMKDAKGGVKKLGMTFATLSSRNEFLGLLKGISSESEFKSLIESPENEIVIKGMGCRTDLYSDEAGDIMYESADEFKNITHESFADIYNSSIAVNGLGNVSEDEVGVLLGLLNPEFDNIKYNDIKDEKMINWINAYFADEKFSEESYLTANVLYKLNTSFLDKIDDLLEEYAKELKIEDNSVYRDYKKASNKTKINMEIVEILEKKQAKTVNAFLDIIEDAMETVEETKKPTGGGGSGGGGSSSSKANGYITAVPTVEQPGNKTEAHGKGIFADMDTASWAVSAVSAMSEAGIINGDDNGNFRPNSPITREEFVKMLVLASGNYNKDAKCAFDDVPLGAWYYSYIASAFENSIAAGISENLFGTGRLLTRQDMAVLCIRAKGETEKVREYNIFADDGDIADYAKDAVKTLYMAGAVNGMGNNMFVPDGQATRAESAQIIYNLFLK